MIRFSKLMCFSVRIAPYRKKKMESIRLLSTIGRRIVLFSMPGSNEDVRFYGEQMCSAFLLNEFWFSRSMKTSICWALLTHNPRRWRIEKNERIACRLVEINVEEAVPQNLDFEKKAAARKEGIVCFLEVMTEDSSNKMPSTGELQLSNYKKEDVYDKICTDFASFKAERHHHVVTFCRNGSYIALIAKFRKFFGSPSAMSVRSWRTPSVSQQFVSNPCQSWRGEKLYRMRPVNWRVWSIRRSRTWLLSILKNTGHSSF